MGPGRRLDSRPSALSTVSVSVCPFLALSDPWQILLGASSGGGSLGDTEPCPPFPPPALAPFPWQTALGLLGCCISEKRSSWQSKYSRGERQHLAKSHQALKGEFLGLFFNFLIWPPAKNVSCIFFLGPSPPPTPSLVSAIPRVLIFYHKTGKSQKWPGAAQLDWVPPMPSHKALASSGVPGRSVGPGV